MIKAQSESSPGLDLSSRIVVGGGDPSLEQGFYFDCGELSVVA